MTAVDGVFQVALLSIIACCLVLIVGDLAVIRRTLVRIASKEEK